MATVAPCSGASEAADALDERTQGGKKERKIRSLAGDDLSVG
jgi:hypothetical protein